MFLAEYDQSKAIMNIGGSDTELRLVSTTGHLRKLGSVATATFRSSNGAVVYATYRTTWLCPKDDTSESCEVTRFNATYEVTTDKRRQTVNAIGDVGC